MARLALARPRHEGHRLRAPHPRQRDQLLLRVPHPARAPAARDLRALLLLPRGGRLRGRARRRGRGRAAALDGGGPALLRRAARRPSWAATSRKRSRAFPSRARASRTSSRAAAWTWRSAATRPSPTCASTASAWPPRSGSPPSRSSATRNPQTRRYAVELGVALQLTNILRDVGADAARGRLYIPLDELHHFRVEEEQIFGAVDGGHNAQLRLLLGYQAERAREHYKQAQALLPPEDRRTMLSAEMMAAVYREILDELVRRGFPIAGPRAAPLDRRARRGSRCAPSSARAGRREGRRRRRRVRGHRGRHRAPGAPPRRHGAGAARRPGRPRDVVPGRGQRRGRGQRHAPDDRRVSRHPRPRPPGGRRGPAARPGAPAHRLPWTTAAGRPSTARRCPRRCTCWPGSSACACRGGRACDAVRLGLAARFGRPPAGLTLTEWFDRLGQGDGRAPAALGAARDRDPERDAGSRGRHPLLQRVSGRVPGERCRVAPGVPAPRLRPPARPPRRLPRSARRAHPSGARGPVAIEIADGAVAGVAYAQRPLERDDIVRGVPGPRRPHRRRRGRVRGALVGAARAAARGLARATPRSRPRAG